MTRSDPPVKTAPGLSAVLPGIGKKPSLPFSSPGWPSRSPAAPPGAEMSWATSPLAKTSACSGLASSESLGPCRGPAASRRTPAGQRLRGVQRALPLVAVLDGEVAALVPDEAGEGVPVLAGQVDALRRRRVLSLASDVQPLVPGLRRRGDAGLGEEVLVVDHDPVGGVPRDAVLPAVDLAGLGQAGDPVGAAEVGDLVGEVLHAAAGGVLGDLGVADLDHVGSVLAGQSLITFWPMPSTPGSGCRG